jgi:arylsulfatase A-like enzyme
VAAGREVRQPLHRRRCLHACARLRSQGLYTQQSWLVQTILSTPDSTIALQPPLNPAYPTHGKLLRQAGYQTPYIGKWHVSLVRSSNLALEDYGFDGLALPDPTGSNLQGTIGNEDEGYLNGRDIAKQAVRWLHSGAPRRAPWCLTVSFVNPHDEEFFWAGTEFPTYNAMFPVGGTYAPFTYYSAIVGDKTYEPLVDPNTNPLSRPRQHGYPAVPPNWETPPTSRRTSRPRRPIPSSSRKQSGAA